METQQTAVPTLCGARVALVNGRRSSAVGRPLNLDLFFLLLFPLARELYIYVVVHIISVSYIEDPHRSFGKPSLSSPISPSPNLFSNFSPAFLALSRMARENILMCVEGLITWLWRSQLRIIIAFFRPNLFHTTAGNHISIFDKKTSCLFHIISFFFDLCLC